MALHPLDSKPDTAEHGEPVHRVRSFQGTQREMGVGFDQTAFFVYDRTIGETTWHKHCGPYSTFQEGADWINAIRETR